MTHLRTTKPTRFGAFPVVTVRDAEAGTRLDVATGKTSPLALPTSDVLLYDLEGGSRVIARPSGTEPKIKFYVDVREAVVGDESIADATRRAEEKQSALAKAFVAAARPS
jgi:phosphomannomutase